MNPRYQVGGDKWYSVREDERRSFFDIVREDDAQAVIEDVKSSVSTYTENQIEMRNEPTFEDYIDKHPEYDHEKLHDTIVKEMERVSAIISRTSQTV